MHPSGKGINFYLELDQKKKIQKARNGSGFTEAQARTKFQNMKLGSDSHTGYRYADE
jgi:hypothetical protein